MYLPRFLQADAAEIGNSVHVFIATPRQIHQNDFVFGQSRRQLHGMGNGMRRLKRRHDALGTAAVVKSRQSFLVVDNRVLRQIGSASCRERVCKYVWISGVAGPLKKKKK